ncbi:putative metal-dependent hydrolase YabD [Endomicrobiia bacterium]|nr:putative metal-dependent hydrolase YabD [Endomicrobiia bacterium]GHT73971.1 putative metal-dependent hydrolase YabD [Endomicrobiia bacterium]
MIIDTHVHVTDLKFNGDREAVIKRAFDFGVEKIIEISCEMSYWDKALELSKKDNVFVSFGIHPVDAPKAAFEDYNKLQTLIQNKKCIAVGEFGLDYHYDSSVRNINIQKESLVRQLDMAWKYNKPVVIHCRDAYDDMIVFLKEYKKIPKGVIHCFCGTANQAKVFVEMGFLLGIDGPVTYKKSETLKQVVLNIDINKLLVETDCPYLAPQKYRGRRNEPSYVVEIVKEIATIKDMSVDETAEITADNAVKLFNI